MDILERRQEIHGKIKGLMKEYAEGKLSTEQFNILYERYQSQLELLLLSETLPTTDNDMNTIAIRKATMAVALGMAIYHHRSGTIIETLGNFDLPPTALSSTLNELSDKIERHEYIQPIIQTSEKAGIYVVYTGRHYTTAIMIFRHEPAQAQLRDVERLHHDFEEANRLLLESNHVDASKLARPFLGFVRKKLGT